MGIIGEKDSEPKIDGLEFYLDAFRELSTARPSGLDIQPISFTSIVEYFKIYELNDFDDFFYLMRRMDLVFLKLNSEKESKNKGSNSAGNKTDKRN